MNSMSAHYDNMPYVWKYSTKIVFVLLKLTWPLHQKPAHILTNNVQ